MKGFYIYENDVFPKQTDCLKLHDTSHQCKLTGWDDPEVTIDGAITKKTYTKCSKKDTYDFETGALIALMRMCGKEKVEKAYLETFFKGGDPGDCPYYQICKEPTIKRLEEENEKLKIDCEKLQKGYSAGLGRLVNINGVNYRECDEKGRVVWFTSQPENFSFFADYIDTDTINTLKGWHKDSEIKCLSDEGPSWLDNKKWKYVSIDEWAYKKPSKREQMWDDILKEGRTPVYVKREYIHDFLKECQTAGIKWSSGKLPLETMPFQMSEGYDGVYFFIMTTLDISKSKRGAKEFRHVMSWWCTADPAEVQAAIHYIRPMRWDLFKKGRRIIRVTHDNIDEFMTKCSNVLGGITRPNLKRYKEFTHLFIMISDYHYDNKPTVHIMTPEDLVRNQYENSKKYSYKKIVNWEDVR